MVYYSWDAVITVGERIRSQGIQDEIELEGLIDLCQHSTPGQRGHLYTILKNEGYSYATLDRLFVTSDDYYEEIGSTSTEKLMSCPFRRGCFTDSTVCGEYQTDECDGVR
jgi:hypothetical protein